MEVNNLGPNFLIKIKKFQKLKIKKFPEYVCRVVASKSHPYGETNKFINDIQGKVELIQVGSSLKFIKIAEGLADIYPRLSSHF